ncbi:MAG: hypothetical protein ACKOXB_07505 [Flavobacteriales bacterium]
MGEIKKIFTATKKNSWTIRALLIINLFKNLKSRLSFICIAIALVLSSCTGIKNAEITKRKYNKGYHADFSFVKKEKSENAEKAITKKMLVMPATKNVVITDTLSAAPATADTSAVQMMKAVYAVDHKDSKSLVREYNNVKSKVAKALVSNTEDQKVSTEGTGAYSIASFILALVGCLSQESFAVFWQLFLV